jgi:hypothetical protein
MPVQVEDAMRYMARAQELRAVAIGTSEGNRREVLLVAADAYEKLATWDPVRLIDQRSRAELSFQ